MNRGDIGENYVAVHYDNDYTCRIFLYYYYSSRMTTVIAIQSLRNMTGIKRQKQNSTITEIQIVYRYRGEMQGNRLGGKGVEVVTYNCLAMVIRLIIKILRVGFSLTRRIRSLFFQLFPD